MSSQTPWKHDFPGIISNKDERICSTINKKCSQKNAIENADLIVKCVNSYSTLKASHERLRKVAKEALDTLMHIEAGGDYNCYYEIKDLEKALEEKE